MRELANNIWSVRSSQSPRLRAEEQEDTVRRCAEGSGRPGTGLNRLVETTVSGSANPTRKLVYERRTERVDVSQKFHLVCDVHYRRVRL